MSNQPNEQPTRRAFLQAAPGAAIAATIAPALPVPKQPAGPDEATLARMREAAAKDGWTVAKHPWGRQFMLGLWQAIEACQDAEDLAPDCRCVACCNMSSFQTVLELFASVVECEYVHGPGFPEWERSIGFPPRRA
jgi:hypothetical protein